MENSRLIIAVILAMAALFAYEQFLQYRYPNLYGPKAKHSPAASPSSAGVTTTPLAPQIATNPVSSKATASSLLPGAPERTVEVSTNYFDAVFTSRGARLVSFRLKKYRETAAKHSPPYEMLRESERMPIGVLVVRGNDTVDDNDVNYSTSAPSTVDVTGPTTVRFSGTMPNGVKLEKNFRFEPSSYVFDLDVAASGGGAPIGLGLTMSAPLTAREGYRDYPELQADIGGRVITEMEKALKKGVAPLSGKISYAGFGDRYFLTALLPEGAPAGKLTMDYSEQEADAAIIFEGRSSLQTRVFMGPKQLDLLERVDPTLSKAIDLGFWGIIALPFLRLLKIFYHVVPNYGVAIILLTVVVRLATLPMSIKGQRSMMRMQRLQPQVTRLREKFKDDSEKLNREMMELYKRNHVNPLGGCLPMVIQFPVFIGLYEALLNAVDLRHAPFVGWIQDLSAPDCLHIAGMPEIPFTTCHGIPVLIALMTISAFLQQWLMPRQADPSQQKMMMYMPVLFSLIFISLPSGLALYYFASNLLGIVQQVILNREFQQSAPEATK